jgi:D-sedoheptulose 7-phosphate isomerase
LKSLGWVFRKSPSVVSSQATISGVSPTASEFTRSYFDRVTDILRMMDLAAANDVAQLFEATRLRGGTVYFIGNGGSASTASHFATDFGIGSHTLDPPLRVSSLTDNAAVLTATGNDFGYDEVFVRQLRVIASPGDVLVAISASGNSPNLVAAFDYAVTVPMTTVAFVAFDGGRIGKSADLCLHVPTDIGEYGPAEDAHLMLNHALSLFIRQLSSPARS